MARRFRLTCARTTYFNVELTADDSVEAERLLDAALAANPALCDCGDPLGRSIHRVVEIAMQEEAAPVGQPREILVSGEANEKPAASERQLA